MMWSRIFALLAITTGSSSAFAPILTKTTSATNPALFSGRGDGYGDLLNDITETVGNTPVVKISDKTCPPGRTIYAKCEFFNPLSSVKDRLALAIIEQAERDGKLKKGDTVVEATSGNTGIAVAMMCAQRGYNCVITMVCVNIVIVLVI